MFDVGFSELLVIAVVALLVLGPERLPKVARTAGILLGRLQRYVNDVKADIHREMQLDELRKMQQQIETSARDLETTVNKELLSVETDLNRSIGPHDTPHALPEPLAEPVVEIQQPAQEKFEAAVATSETSPQLELGLGGTTGVSSGKS